MEEVESVSQISESLMLDEEHLQHDNEVMECGSTDSDWSPACSQTGNQSHYEARSPPSSQSTAAQGADWSLQRDAENLPDFENEYKLKSCVHAWVYRSVGISLGKRCKR